MSPKVLQVLGRSAGGIARHVGQLVEGLHGTHDLQIDVAGPPDLPIPIPRRIHDVLIPDGPLRGHLPAIRHLARVVQDEGYDVVHAHGLRAGIDAGRAARRCSRPAFLSVHNLVRPEVAGRLRAQLYAWAEVVAVRSSDRVFTVSMEIAGHLRRKVPDRADAIEVLYLGIGEAPPVVRTRAQVRGELGLTDDEALIVTVARLAPQKSLGVLLAAVAELPGGHLAILGEGPLEDELRRLARDLGISGRVSFLGFRADVDDVVAAADVFCLSSAWEGVPLAAQEAILLRTPIVATNVGGLPELVEDNVSGRLVPRDSPGTLAAALLQVLDNPDLARRYTSAALERLRVRFSTERMLARLSEAYHVACDVGPGMPEA